MNYLESNSFREMIGKRAALLAVAAALSLLGCADNRSLTAPPQLAIDCEIGCVDVDPYPSAPGVFLGSGVTPGMCWLGDYTDADLDELGDFCEKKLAAAFAPELYYYQFDNVARDPRWVARFNPDHESVYIGYLISYYRDEGSLAPICSAPGAPSSCNGHNGDSEVIFLTITYNYSTSHWVLNQAFYSQHESYGFYYADPQLGYPQLYYPSHPGAYPRAYVSQGKHANYATVAECNSGGFWNTDTCEEVDYAARVSASEYRNIGSSVAHTSSQDCVGTNDPYHPYYLGGGVECYWTGARFRGWYPTSVGGADSDPYSDRLLPNGF